MQKKEKLFAEENQKVTDSYLRRVLAVSICGILLCMSCLVGMTYAWFVVDIENSDNLIQIATGPAAVDITENGESLPLSLPNLSAGTHILQVVHTGEMDDLQQKSKLYVTFSVDATVMGYVLLNHDVVSVEIVAPEACFVSWTVSWFKPSGAEMLQNNRIDVPAGVTNQPTEETTDPTVTTTQEPETEPTVPETTVPATTVPETTVPATVEQPTDEAGTES